jgi:hypothetical protein
MMTTNLYGGEIMQRRLLIISFLLVSGIFFPSMAILGDSISANENTAIEPSDFSFVEVWSEDFSDGGFGEWKTMGLNISGGPSIMAENLAIVDGVLVSGPGPDFNIANHSSTVVYGKWEFDFYVVTGDWHHSAVYLTKDGWYLEEGVENGYAIAFAEQSWSISQPAIHIAKSQDNHSTWHEYWLTPVNNTWFHIEVTHLTNGTFNVHVNGTHRITWTDNELPVSSQFELALEPGCMVDNIVVSELVEETTTTSTTTITTTTTTTTTTTDGAPDLTLLVVGGAGIAIIAIVVVILLKRK